MANAEVWAVIGLLASSLFAFVIQMRNMETSLNRRIDEVSRHVADGFNEMHRGFGELRGDIAVLRGDLRRHIEGEH